MKWNDFRIIKRSKFVIKNELHDDIYLTKKKKKKGLVSIITV